MSLDGERWIACRPGFFLPVRVLSRLFRRLVLEKLAAAHCAGQLQFFGKHAALTNAQAFAAAERDGHIIGLACLVIPNNELRACYVAPEAARTGVGKALLIKIEETARNAGVKYLYADSSLTAEQFYRSQGYEVIEYGQHFLRGRWPMACVKMRKAL
jgi:GNAT superfamily N-acetyltransferase